MQERSMTQEYIDAHPEGGPISSTFVTAQLDEHAIAQQKRTDGFITLIEGICGYAGAPYGKCTSEMIEKNKRGWQGFDTWTEKIRRENKDGTYYYVYRDHNF